MRSSTSSPTTQSPVATPFITPGVGTVLREDSPSLVLLIVGLTVGGGLLILLSAVIFLIALAIFLKRKKRQPKWSKNTTVSTCCNWHARSSLTMHMHNTRLLSKYGSGYGLPITCEHCCSCTAGKYIYETADTTREETMSPRYIDHSSGQLRYQSTKCMEQSVIRGWGEWE